MKKLLFLLLIGSSFGFFSCTSDLVVTERPTQPVYVRSAAPSAEYVWIDGDWHRRKKQYVWREGRWDRRRAGYEWRAGSWQPRSNGYYWSRGRWHRLN